MSNFNTPILFNVFNRPDCTQTVFNEIKKQKPRKLYIHCDGPRKNNPSDIEKINLVKKIFETQIDWECEKFFLYREENLGCGRGPASAISWFFKHNEMGIILEDDCVPHLLFFHYCEELLNKYKDNLNIGIISGGNIHGVYSDLNSYFFSITTGMWGWATWRRVWDDYNFDLEYSKNDLERALSEYKIKSKIKKSIHSLYKKVLSINRDSYWDYQLDYMLLINKYINIKPNSNFTTNIGDGEDATHTKIASPHWQMNVNIDKFIQIEHPSKVETNCLCDKEILMRTYYISPLRIIRGRIKKVIKKIL